MEKNNKNTFYMVFLQSGNSPNYQHETYVNAISEAKRLSEKFNKKAWVLKAVTSVKKNDWDIEHLDINDTLPF